MNKHRILIVEDDAFSRDMLQRRLTARGFHVDEAEHGQAGLDRLESGPAIDLVLLDIAMPGKNGLEVLRLIRETRTPQELPVLMVSAHGESEDVIAGLEAGANDYVAKPLEMPVLMARINASLRIKDCVDDLVMAEQQRVMVQSLGTACHHMAQPLTVAAGQIDLIIGDLPGDPSRFREELDLVRDSLLQAAQVIHKLQEIAIYRTVPYVEGTEILDLKNSPPGADSPETGGT